MSRVSVIPRVQSSVDPKIDGQHRQFTRQVSSAIEQARKWSAETVEMASGDAPDCNKASVFRYIAASSPITIAAPVWGENGRRISIEIRNGSGGDLTVNWNAAYVFVTSYVAPADGEHNTVQFHYDVDAEEWREELRQVSLDAAAAAEGNVDFGGHQAVSLVIENRTSDPSSPVTGQIWLRTDL